MHIVIHTQSSWRLRYDSLKKKNPSSTQWRVSMCLQVWKCEEIRKTLYVSLLKNICTQTNGSCFFPLWNTDSFGAFPPDRGLIAHGAPVCLKAVSLRHIAATRVWNHLCRHTSINQHRKDVWHHETTRFTSQAKSSKCFHTELLSFFYSSDYAARGLGLPEFHVQYVCVCVCV